MFSSLLTINFIGFNFQTLLSQWQYPRYFSCLRSHCVVIKSSYCLLGSDSLAVENLPFHIFWFTNSSPSLLIRSSRNSQGRRAACRKHYGGGGDPRQRFAEHSELLSFGSLQDRFPRQNSILEYVPWDIDSPRVDTLAGWRTVVDKISSYSL